MTDPDVNDEIEESNQSLWLLTIGPGIWAVHFLASYVTAAIWCAKFSEPDHSLAPVRLAIAAYTAVAVIGIGITGWLGYRRHDIGNASLPHDFDTREDRHRFLGFATLLLAALSFVATLMVALTAVFLETCH